MAFRGQGDAAVRQIASMNDSYGYTIVDCVWPHYSSSISQLAAFFVTNSQLTQADDVFLLFFCINRTDHDLCIINSR